MTAIEKLESDSLDAICEVIGAPREYNSGKSAMREWFLDRLRNDGFPKCFQDRVKPWLDACFGPQIAIDKVERNYRFLEEALELVQSTGLARSEAHQLVDYVYGREVGDPHQEVGGVMNTLAALCLAQGLDMHKAGEHELARVWTKVEKIREKQQSKPRFSPLPGNSALDRAAVDVLAERRRQIEDEGWSAEHDDRHSAGQMALASATYILHPLAKTPPQQIEVLKLWPWFETWWKPGPRRRMLVKAGALILAEIERLDREAAHNGAAS